MSEVAWWQGEHGDEYTERNADVDLFARRMLWTDIMLHINPQSILEIGAGSGSNLYILHQLHCCNRKHIVGVEPNDLARREIERLGFSAYDGTAVNPGQSADLVFTSGVLIHIPPDELLAACQGIYDAAERYIVSIEYFSADPEEKPYRGRKLWKRDFGDFWMENFPLQHLGNGFAWKRTTGLDNLTWWAFSK